MVGPSRMTLASDRPPSPHPGGGEREVQGTLRVGVGGATGRVSRERSNRGGVGLAQEAAGPHPRVSIHTPLWEMAYFELNARRWQARVGWGVPPPVFVIYVFLAYFKLNARRWQARVPRGRWMPLRWAQSPSG